MARRKALVRRRVTGITVYIGVANPFAEGGPLHGFTPSPEMDGGRGAAKQVRRAFNLSVNATQQYRAGRLPDGRIALVAPGEPPERFAIDCCVRRQYKLRHAYPIEPLPEEQARAILHRLYRGVDWNDVLDRVEAEKNHSIPQRSVRGSLK
ncbi:hypothetical protein rosag_28640 [Roseisolibacter agri]|uniref:Uncharacterized protein n=1 Tax=Roseisolibacter agri TaxID=2014610 RepID=A0AA37V7A3_9BACT|nr:hypothetical protein rosag_28640 [Roseisolibacter agri]